MKNFIGWGGIVLMCALVGAGWGHAENQRKECKTRQDPLQQLWQEVDYLERRVDVIADEVNGLYQWAKACEKRVIEGEKREAQLERRVRKLEGRLFGRP